MGRAIVTILMVIYQLESDQTSDRMTANVQYKREVLRRHWGPTPFGCARNSDGQLIPTTTTFWLNSVTGEAKSGALEQPGENWELRNYYDGLVEVYRVYALGQHSYDTVAELVNDAGWRYYANAKGNKPRKFTRDDIRRLVSFWQLYRGDLPLGNITNDKGITVVEGGHNPILPVELCDQVGLVKKRRGGNTWSRNGNEKRIYLASDVTFCAVCQKKMKGYFQDGRRVYRHYGAKQGCPEKWQPADDIEQ